ncbi:MAG: type II toxin-antitoxin system PemK/MazF family toxin [Gammaproteobacteria bacterium]
MKRGDVVLALFPHASGTPARRRPALVVQADFYNRKISNVLLAPITSNLARQGDSAHFLIDVSTPDGHRSGLNQNSLVSCLNVGVVPVAVVGPKIGELTPAAMVQIDARLKAAFGIP